MLLILVLTQINEPVQHVMDTDTKKLNYNFFQILTFHVNSVMEVDINQKYYESLEDEKLLVKF
jgi:hypothetical protein